MNTATASRKLWPLFHYRPDLATFDREHYQGCLKVNRRFVQGVADALRTALDMPPAERKAWWRKLVEGVLRDDVTAWRESFLERLYAMR